MREYLRPGPCLESPRIGWDGLDMERLPPPVDQAGPRPRPGQRGGLQPLSSMSHEEDREAAAAAAGGRRSSCVGFGAALFRVVATEGVRVRRGADIESAKFAMLGEGTEALVVEEQPDGKGRVAMRLSTPVEGWISKRGGSVVALSRSSPPGASRARGGSGTADENETGEAAEVALARELEDCMEEEAGTDLYRRDDRLFGSRQGWSLPSGGSSGLGGGGRGGVSGRTDSRVPGERRAIVVGHASVWGCWAAMSSMSISATKEKLASTAATLAVLHCRKILLTVLLQCHKEVMRATEGGSSAADALFSQRVASLVGARDSLLPTSSSSRGSNGSMVSKAGVEVGLPRVPQATLRTRAASRQFSSFLQLVLFRGWRPSWWPLVDGSSWSDGGQGGDNAHRRQPSGVRNGEDDGKEDERACLDDKEPMSECFRSLPVVLTPLVLSLLRAAAAQRVTPGSASSELVVAREGGAASVRTSRGQSPPPRLQSFGAHVEEAMLQSVASQLRQATRIGHRDHAWTSSDVAEMSDTQCLRYPRLRFVTWAARVVQAGSRAPTVPRRIFHAWAVGLRSPSLPVKRQVCAELSRLLDEAGQAVDRAYRVNVSKPVPVGVDAAGDCVNTDRSPDAHSMAAAGLQQAVAVRHLKQCVELLPMERLRSLAERRMLKEGEDEPMLSRALQSIVDLVASAELASRVLREHQAARNDKVSSLKNVEVATSPVPSTVTGATGTSVVPQEPLRQDSAGEAPGRSVLCFPSPSAYVALQGRDLEPPWTAEFWLLRPNSDGTWEADIKEDTYTMAQSSGCSNGEADTEGKKVKEGKDSDEKEDTPRPLRPLDFAPSAFFRRGINKSFSEGVLSTTNSDLPSMSRAVSTPSTSVDLTLYPEMEAPALFRAQSTEAVGQRSRVGEGGVVHSEDFSPSFAASSIPLENGPRGVGIRMKNGDNGLSTFTAALMPPAVPTAGRKNRLSPWSGQMGTRGVGGGAGGGQSGEQRGGATASTKRVDDEAGSKGVMGTVPLEYLASSQAGHIRLQTGGTVFSPSVGERLDEDGNENGDDGTTTEGGKENTAAGGSGGGKMVTKHERLVESEALCVSMGLAGEKERAFDFVVPTGRWVHLAIVASSQSGGRTTLYIDGEAKDAIAFRMSLPMGGLGAGPQAQEASAASGGGGSFVGLLAQTRRGSRVLLRLLI